jgi:hypothetical protein
MPEEHKHESSEPKRPKTLPFNIKIGRNEVIVIIASVIVLAVMSIPPYLPLNDCEVARPAYKCASFQDVMKENCVYWGNFSCNTASDASLPDVEWYILNMCKLQNQYHGTGLDCANLKAACNRIVGNQTCPVAY